MVVAEYHNQSKLRFWCQMVLPLVYDDSLSYMELLNKVVSYLNNCIQDVGNCETNIESLLEAFVNLQDYVNEMVEDISPEIESVIDQMIENGDFTEILADALNTVVAPEYDEETTYLQYEYVLYEGNLYRANTTTSGEFDPTKWTEKTIAQDLTVLERYVYGLTANDVPYDGTQTYDAGSTGKAIKDLAAEVDSLDAGDIAYNSSTTYNNATVGKELGDLKDAINSVEETLNSNIDGLVIQQVPDYYINDTSGVLNNPTSGSGWRYIKTPAFAGDKFIISVRWVSNPAGYYFADANNNVLAKDTTESLIENALVEAPENSAWLVLNTHVTWLKTLYCCKLNKKVVVAPSGGDFTSLTEALYSTTDDVIVKAGTYNIVNEYKALFGNDIFSNISDSYRTIGYFRYGLFVNNRKVIFESGAYVTCDLTGVLTVNSTHRFSAFNLGVNATIIGLKCYAPNTWYNIHDDYGDDSYYINRIENCILNGAPVNANIIGGGTRNHSTNIVKNCTLDNGNNASESMRYHNYNSANAEPTVIVEGCHINGTIGARYYGSQSSPHMKFIAINNEARDVKKLAESSGFNVDNVDLYVTNCGEPITANEAATGMTWTVTRFPNGFAILQAIDTSFTYPANSSASKTYNLPFTLAEAPFVMAAVFTTIPDKLHVAPSGVTFNTITLTCVSNFVNDQTPRTNIFIFGRWK